MFWYLDIGFDLFIYSFGASSSRRAPAQELDRYAGHFGLKVFLDHSMPIRLSF